MKKSIIIPVVALLITFATAGFVLAQNSDDDIRSELERIVAAVVDKHEDEMSQEDIVDDLYDSFSDFVSDMTVVEDDSNDDDDDESIKSGKWMNFGQFKKTLRQGTAGPEVEAIQAALNDLADEYGLNFPTLTEDGIYGPMTAHVVRLFQMHRRISADGVVGPNTIRNLQDFFNRDRSDDDDSDDDIVDEVEGVVESVDVSAGEVTLEDGTVIRVTEDTVIDAAGDFNTLSAITGTDDVVEAEAEGAFDDEGVFIADTVKFETDA